MNVDPGRPAFRARVNLDSPREYAGQHRKRKSGDEFPLAIDAKDTGRQVGVNVV
jgi:hypothetical protein